MTLVKNVRFAFVAAAVALSASVASAQELRPWMHSEIGAAWSQGYKGQGTSITVIDDFRSRSRITGDLRGTTEALRHGEWTSLEARMIAPSATVFNHDFNTNSAVKLRTGLNILNLSYAWFSDQGGPGVNWNRRETSIIDYAQQGKAVVVKAAGNDSIAVGAANSWGLVDYLNRDLIGDQSAIFVGALNSHGTVDNKASLASYSNIAGNNATVQNQFLVVGVTRNTTGLSGTSFAAPIVAGYAAVLGSKFNTATPTQIANQLLDTARTDTISGYAANVHGRGEASIARALSPSAIE
jgi:subtilisin family serine protease